MTKKPLVLLILALAAAACGSKGDPVLEPEKIPLGITDLQVRQVGGDLILSWTFPEQLADKKSRLEYKNLKKIRIYSGEKLLPARAFQKKADLILKKDAAALESRGKAYSVAFPQKIRYLKDKPHHFAVVYAYGRKKSPLSNIASIRSVVPITPVTDLKLNKENKVIKLSWSRPTTNVSGQSLKRISGYRVYRKVEKGDFKPLGEGSVLQEYYEDAQTSIDGTYTYRVSTLVSQQIESEPSNPVSVDVKDIFPPDPPANLVSFRAADSIFLTWNPVKDADLSHYRLYRRGEKETETILLLDGLKQNYHKDTTVEKGRTYRYTVTAVDGKGNESPPSNEVSETFE